MHTCSEREYLDVYQKDIEVLQISPTHTLDKTTPCYDRVYQKEQNKDDSGGIVVISHLVSEE